MRPIHPLALLAIPVLLLAWLQPASAQAKGSRQRPPAQGTRPLTAEQKDDQHAIEELHQRDIRYSIADDLVGLSTLWTEDIVSLPPNSPPIVGREANLEWVKSSQKGTPTMEILSYDQQWSEMRISGDWAWEWGTISSRVRPASASNQEVQLTYKVARLLQRQPDGSWLIARSIWNEIAPPAAAKPAPVEEKKNEKPRTLDR